MNNYIFKNNTINYIGDYCSHRGTPSLLRSDSMLKAIGKAINIRVSGYASAQIPLIILGNTPITRHYRKKVDFLKRAGIIQSFISLYPTLSNAIQNSKDKGFQTFKEQTALTEYVERLIHSEMNFFASMLSKKELGEMIHISSQKTDDISRAESFLNLIRKEES